jgi:hypothetical protein
MEVLLFATNVNTAGDVAQISPAFETLVGVQRWTVDTSDCDKVLRIIAVTDISMQVELLLFQQGYTCQRMRHYLQTHLYEPHDYRLPVYTYRIVRLWAATIGRKD